LQLATPHVRARLRNTPTRSVVAPSPQSGRRGRRVASSLLVAGVLCVGLPACGGTGAPGAESLLNDTFKSHAPIESGRIDLSLGFSSVGQLASLPLKGPLYLHLQGPFQSAGAGQLPRFALQAEVKSGGLLTAPGQTLNVGATSTGSQLFIELGGTPFQAPAATVQALEQGYAQASRASSSAKGRSTFSALGVDPGEWLTHPTIVASEQLAGEDTVHIAAGLNAPRFLSDASKLSSAGGALGLGTAGQSPGSFSASEVAAIEGSLRSARVDVYTGAQDHLLRRLSLRVELATTPAARAALGGLRSATLALNLAFAQINKPQAIAAPANPQPISELLPVLERLGLVRGSGG
jgi:hypothetical protein